MQESVARMILRKNHICPIHGIAMVHHESGYVQVYYDWWECPSCVRDNRVKEKAELAEAKKVLGF